MIGIVLASHGKLAKEMLSSAEMIMGPQENIIALALEPNDDPTVLSDTIKESAKKVEGEEGAIVLVDLMGGSPCNAAAYIAKAGVPVITGMNLPILLELITMRNSLVEEIIEHLVDSGKEGIMDIRKIFKEDN